MSIPSEYQLSNRQKFVLVTAKRNRGRFYAGVNDAGVACMRLCERGLMKQTGKRTDGAFICRITEKGEKALALLKEAQP